MNIYEAARLDEDVDLAASEYIRSLSADERRAKLRELVMQEIRNIRRQDALAVERRQDADYNREQRRLNKQHKERLDRLQDEAHEKGYQTIWGMAIGEFQKSIRLEVTAELLRTGFALPDGRLVTWGTATVDEHRIRMDMLVKQGIGTLETAYRHRVAIGMLDDSGAGCLSDMASAEVAA